MNPIETAPKDGRWILVAFPGVVGWFYDIIRWEDVSAMHDEPDFQWCTRGNKFAPDHLLFAPARWMPLEDPPSNGWTRADDPENPIPTHDFNTEDKSLVLISYFDRWNHPPAWDFDICFYLDFGKHSSWESDIRSAGCRPEYWMHLPEMKA